jgi:hypothetical protein
MMINHYIKIKNSPQYKTATVRIYIEANMSFITANQMAIDIKSHPALRGQDIQIVKFDPNGLGRYGVWTSPASKEQWMAELTRNISVMRTVEAKNFITSRRPATLLEDVSQVHLDQFCEQLKQMRVIVTAPPEGHGSSQLFPRRSITGKSAGKKDDRVASACIALVHMMHDCFSNPALRREFDKPMLAVAGPVRVATASAA